MPKYVRTLVKKSSIVPWLTDSVLKEDSTHLTAEEKQLLVDASNEAKNFPGFVNYQVTTVGNTQIVSYEFDNMDNLNNFINKNFDKRSEIYDGELKLSKYYNMIAKKVQELGLKDTYRVTYSIENE